MKSLKVISISHQTAGLHLRQQLHLDDEESTSFLTILKKQLSVKGAMLLATCNRTEVYFEAENISTEEVLGELLQFKAVDVTMANYFDSYDTTEEAAKYLLEVAGGMRSMVMGDMQIINQIKRSFQKSVALGLQGKLLERAVQALFKMHKRIHNETAFRSGTASLSYLGLKVCQQQFGKKAIQEKSLLIVGAGEISQDVAKYAHKFQFKKIAIVNRTYHKAQKLAKEHGFEVERWKNLTRLAHQYDVIATGVSNSSSLFAWQPDFENLKQPKIFIDLGLPANVDHELNNHEYITVLNLDELAAHTQKVEQKRLQAAKKVKTIIQDELAVYMKWTRTIPASESIKSMKLYLQDILTEQLQQYFGEDIPENVQEQFIKKVSNEFVKKPAATLHGTTSSQEFAHSLQRLFV